MARAYGAVSRNRRATCCRQYPRARDRPAAGWNDRRFRRPGARVALQSRHPRRGERDWTWRAWRRPYRRGGDRRRQTSAAAASACCRQAIAAVARAGEILVSTTVRDIVPGSGMHFADAGDRVPAAKQTIPRLLIVGGEGDVGRPGSPARRVPSIAQLSPREREVLVVVARGMTNAEIAGALELSEHTVKRHVANILDQARSRQPFGGCGVRRAARIALNRFVGHWMPRKSHA